MKHLCLIMAVFTLTACSGKTGPSNSDVLFETPGAYMIVQGKNYDPKDLGPYSASLPPIYEKYGGRYVALSTDIDIAEGENDAQAIIISAWPDAASARKFWDSPEYSESKKLRDGIGDFDVVIVPALPF